MEEKGGTLQVTLRKTVISEEELKTKQNLHAGTYIQLTVSDTGIGITQELIEKIFDPYFSTKEVGKGTGMGLAIVQSIVKNHGGFVSVYSIPGQGSTFNVFFPRIQNRIADNQIDEAYEIPRGTEKILFIDDENMVTEVGKSMLERLGYSVTASENSAEALKLFQSDPSSFDLVITDQTMPNIQGSDLAIQLLQIRPDIPIILCTGYSSLIDEAKAQQIGIKGYAMKPVDLKVIARLIRNLLDNQSPS
jgi:CheY-like chemotaxis protein